MMVKWLRGFKLKNDFKLIWKQHQFRLSFVFHYFIIWYISFQVTSEAVAGRCSEKQLLRKLWETSQKDIFGGVIFLILFLACLNSDSIEHLQMLLLDIKISNIAFSVWKYLFQHGTIIRTGITYKKMPCHLRDSGCRKFIVKKVKIFWSYVKVNSYVRVSICSLIGAAAWSEQLFLAHAK